MLNGVQAITMTIGRRPTCCSMRCSHRLVRQHTIPLPHLAMDDKVDARTSHE